MPGALGRVLRAAVSDVTPLRESPAFRRLFAGQAVSLIGTQMTLVAVPLQVYAITRSSLQVGLVGLVGVVPLVAFGLYGGAIADAVDRRRLLMITSTATMLVSAVLFVLAALRVDRVWLLLGCVAVQSAASAVDSPVRGAIIPHLVRREKLAAANTLGFGSHQVAGVAGPLLAAVIVHAVGFAGAYAVDVVSFAGVLYAATRLPRLPPGDGARAPGLASVLEGLRFLATRPVVMMTFLADLTATVLAWPRALVPALAYDRYGGADTAGLLYAALSAGALAAALAGGAIGRVRRHGLGVVVAVAGFGVAIALLGLAPTLGTALVLLAVAGAADTVSAVYRATILQAATPDGMRGRLQGVFVVVVVGGPRLGDLRTGAMATAFTPGVSLVAGGIACVVGIVLLALAVPAFTRYDAAAPP